MGSNAAALDREPRRPPARAVRRRVMGAWQKTSGRRAGVALVLAAVLLACHGLFGAYHVLGHGAPPQAAAPSADLSPQGHPDSAGHGIAGSSSDVPHGAGVPDEDGHRVPHGPSSVAAGYFAVLFALAGVVLLAALFGTPRMDPMPGRRVLATRTVPRTVPLPRGPSPPLLQVFRL